MIDNKMYLQRNGDEVELHQISQTRCTNAINIKQFNRTLSGFWFSTIHINLTKPRYNMTKKHNHHKI